MDAIQDTAGLDQAVVGIDLDLRRAGQRLSAWGACARQSPIPFKLPVSPNERKYQASTETSQRGHFRPVARQKEQEMLPTLRIGNRTRISCLRAVMQNLIRPRNVTNSRSANKAACLPAAKHANEVLSLGSLGR